MAAADISHWLIPARLNASGALELAHPPDDLPSGRFCLEWWIGQHLSPAAERQAADLFQPWFEHPRALRLEGRPLLWIRDPEQLCHPVFTRQRLASALLIAAAPPELHGFDAIYECSDRIPCQMLEGGASHYESYLFHAHHRPVGEAPMFVPCVTAQPQGPVQCATAINYREWLALSRAWSQLRHPDPDQRLVLVEHWASHAHWHQQAPAAQGPSVEEEEIPACQELRWGSVDPERPALLVHGFHLDLLADMLKPIAPGPSCPFPLALYVSTPLAQMGAVQTLLREQGWDQVCVVGVPNRGRDVAPFVLELLPRALQAGHPWLVKLHTKRSLQTPGGESWGRHLIDQLASADALVQLQQHFSDQGTTALVAPSGALLPTTVCLSGNSTAVDHLLRRLQIEPRWWLAQTFVAGSMWAARSSALDPFLQLVNSWAEFEPELGQIDGTLAHALERMVPAVLAPARSSMLSCLAGFPRWTSPFGHPWANPTKALGVGGSP